MTEETRTELEAALAARKELGPAYEHDLVESFLAKLERGIDRRHEPAPPPAAPAQHHGPGALLGSVALGIPVTAVALSNAHGAGGVIVAIVAWIAIAVANLAYWHR